VGTGNWDFLMEQYDLTADPLVRNALACTPHDNQIQAYVYILIIIADFLNYSWKILFY
jgi:hypothetical protein